MNRKKAMVVLLWSISFLCYAQTAYHEIDTEQSTIAFSITHMGLLTVEGHFTGFTGSMIIDSQKELKDIQSIISVHSIDTGDTSRDQTLRSEAYLHASKHPQITFNATQITTDTITGILQIKEVKKEIHLPYIFLNTKNTDAIGIRMTTTLSRSDFKLDFGAMNMLIGDTIKIELTIYKK
ncbi:YceI family protein [Dokdonia sp.]|uniref:YceI family protein n=1 Tax=Dokdonia sp. TaxID=2024995 RepID=UPI0032648B6D